MKQKARTGVVFVAAGLLSAGLLASAETVIDSFSEGGVIRWQVSGSPTTCDVEWASSPAGPWQKSWDGLKGIVVTGTSAQASVPMFFRVARTDAWMQEGLVLHLPCNGDLLDHSAYGNNPTMNGFGDLSLDRVGSPSSSLRLDAGEYLSVAGNASLTMTNVTVALWAKFDNPQGNYPFLLEMGPHASVWSLFVDQVASEARSGWLAVRGGASSPEPRLEEVIVSNRWYHLAATISGTRAILYMDGVARTTGAVAAVKTTIGTLTIGRPSSALAPPDNCFAGSMDDIRIYNRELSATEMAQLHLLAP